MTRLLLLLLTLLFSLSGPAMGVNGDFGRCTIAAKAGGRTIADTLPKGITDIKNAKEASSEASRITSQHSTFVN